MKQPVQFFRCKPFFIMLLLCLTSLVIWGQEQNGNNESATSTTTTTTSKSTSVSITNDAADTWYTSPWVWVIGAAVFVLLLVAILSGRGRDKVRVTKTVEKSNN